MADEPRAPRHIGYILDGNRRWARKHGVPVYEGHLAGYNALKDIIKTTADAGVSYISLYAFSNENWKRDAGEVGKLMKLAMRAFRADLQELIDANLRVKVIGRRDRLDQDMQEAIDKVEAATAHLTKSTVCVCFNYGGQQEIVDAYKAIMAEGVSPDEVDEEVIAKHLYAPEVPPVDVVVRTSNEQRISNFMLWRVAYSEFLFLEKYWPDMRPEDVQGIIEEYSNRSRRFGG